MSRSVSEWIGRSDNSMPSDACRRRILDRQGECCAPLWLGGENRESNLQAITKEAHAAKTKAEATVRAKVNRIRIKRVLGKKPSSLSNPRFKKLMSGEVVDRRTGEVVRR